MTPHQLVGMSTKADSSQNETTREYQRLLQALDDTHSTLINQLLTKKRIIQNEILNDYHSAISNAYYDPVDNTNTECVVTNSFGIRAPNNVNKTNCNSNRGCNHDNRNLKTEKNETSSQDNRISGNHLMLPSLPVINIVTIQSIGLGSHDQTKKNDNINIDTISSGNVQTDKNIMTNKLQFENDNVNLNRNTDGKTKKSNNSSNMIDFGYIPKFNVAIEMDTNTNTHSSVNVNENKNNNMVMMKNKATSTESKNNVNNINTDIDIGIRVDDGIVDDACTMDDKKKNNIIMDIANRDDEKNLHHDDNCTNTMNMCLPLKSVITVIPSSRSYTTFGHGDTNMNNSNPNWNINSNSDSDSETHDHDKDDKAKASTVEIQITTESTQSRYNHLNLGHDNDNNNNNNNNDINANKDNIYNYPNDNHNSSDNDNDSDNDMLDSDTDIENDTNDIRIRKELEISLQSSITISSNRKKNHYEIHIDKENFKNNDHDAKFGCKFECKYKYDNKDIDSMLIENMLTTSTNKNNDNNYNENHDHLVRHGLETKTNVSNLDSNSNAPRKYGQSKFDRSFCDLILEHIGKDI